MKKMFFLIVPLLVLLWGCKKTFQDGPAISFRGEGKRLEGQWKLQQYLVNNIDSTSYYNNYFGNECIFDLQYNTIFPYTITWGKDSARLFTKAGGYAFNGDKIDFGSNPNTYNSAKFVSAISDTVEFEITILKLKYKEMWLQVGNHGKQYEYHLINIKKYPPFAIEE